MDRENFRGAVKIASWNQEDASRRVGYSNGMCIIFAFYFGARYIQKMDINDAIQETKELSMTKGILILNALKGIYDYYLKGRGNFYDEVMNIAMQYEKHQIVARLSFSVVDYDNFRKDNEHVYEGMGLHTYAADDLRTHYFRILHSSKFLMIGITLSSGLKHAMTLVFDLYNETFILFDPNYGWFRINDISEFMNDYGNQFDVIVWDFVIVQMR